jgi:hypothetical protein
VRAAVKHLKACCPDLFGGGTSRGHGSGVDMPADWVLLERQEELLAARRSQPEGTEFSSPFKEVFLLGGGSEPDLVVAESRIRDKAESLLNSALELESRLREEAIGLAFRWKDAQMVFLMAEDHFSQG